MTGLVCFGGFRQGHVLWVNTAVCTATTDRQPDYLARWLKTAVVKPFIRQPQPDVLQHPRIGSGISGRAHLDW